MKCKAKDKKILIKGDEVFVVDINNFIPDGPFVVERDFLGNQWVYLVGQKCKRIGEVYVSERLAKDECIRNIDRKIRFLTSIKKRRLEG